MNKEQVSGNVDQATGKAKETVGKLTDDHETQAEGVVDQVKGKAKEAIGDVKQSIHDHTK